jgi:hypothetical protein
MLGSGLGEYHLRAASVTVRIASSRFWCTSMIVEFFGKIAAGRTRSSAVAFGLAGQRVLNVGKAVERTAGGGAGVEETPCSGSGMFDKGACSSTTRADCTCVSSIGSPVTKEVSLRRPVACSIRTVVAPIVSEVVSAGEDWTDAFEVMRAEDARGAEDATCGSSRTVSASLISRASCAYTNALKLRSGPHVIPSQGLAVR